MRAFAAAALVGMFVAVLPAPAALAVDKPDLAVTSAADKASYAEGETFTITVTVKNNSSVDATRVHYNGGDSEGVEGVVYGEMSTGFDLAAGATRTFQLTGKTTNQAWRYGHGYVAFELAADNGEANDADNVTGVRLPVPGGFADLSGYVFQGESPSAVWTPQTPGLAGVKVVATSADGRTRFTEAVTDAKGLFRLPHLPAGDALLTFTTPAGWAVMAGENGATDHTMAQIIAGESDEPRIHVPAKQGVVNPPSPSVTRSPAVSPSPGVSPSVSRSPGVSPSASLSASPSPSVTASPGLPLTGANVMLLIGGGTLAVAVGLGLLLLARRRRVRLQP